MRLIIFYFGVARWQEYFLFAEFLQLPCFSRANSETTSKYDAKTFRTKFTLMFCRQTHMSTPRKPRENVDGQA